MLLFSESAFDLIAIATSKGGLQALAEIFKELPPDFPVPILVVQHLAPQASPNTLPQLLQKYTALHVQSVVPGALLQPHTIYVAPPDWHTIVTEHGTLDLIKTERVNFTRPAADVLFHSMADQIGQRAIAVVLTGCGKDGAAGIAHLKQTGGTTIAQDADSSVCFAMPQAAIRTRAVDWVLPLSHIAATLIRLVT